MSRTVTTMCPMNCHPTLCGMQVTVDDAGGVSIAGDPDNPDSQGFLCLRGRVSGEIMESPERIIHAHSRMRRDEPLRRVGMDAALARLCEHLGNTPPESFGIWLGHGDAASNYGTRLGGLLSRRFAQMYGAQWWHPAMICWGLGGLGAGLTGVLDVNTKEDMSAHADLIIMWGANNASQPNTGPHVKTARKRGARIVVIDVRESEATARADLVLRIRPGTDAALALALLHVIVRDDLTDAHFIAEHTLGFDNLSEHLSAFTPDWGAAETGIDAEQIEALAREYANTPRAQILLGGSSLHKMTDGWQVARAVTCLPAITGKLGKPGAGMGPRHGASTHGQGLNTLLPETGNQCREVIPDQMTAMLEAFEAGRIKTLLLVGTDMLSSFADANRLRRALENVELIVSVDLFPNDTIREVADIVLPGTTWLEQLGCKMTNTHLYLMEQALAPAGDACSLSTLLRELATRLGVADFFPWEDDAGYIDAVINHASTGHATVAALRAEDGRRALNISHYAYPDYAFHSPSGKVEFTSERAIELGLPALPSYTPPVRDEGYPLLFRQGRSLTHFHGFYDHGQALPSLRKRGGRPTLWIAPADAETRGIETGDAIRVFNQRGSMQAHAEVTDRIDPGAVWMRDGWSGINNLTASHRCVPDAASSVFPFGVGQAAYEASIEVAPNDSP